MRAHGGDAFRDIKVHTYCEDWSEKRKSTNSNIQKMVREASQGGSSTSTNEWRTGATRSRVDRATTGVDSHFLEEPVARRLLFGLMVRF